MRRLIAALFMAGTIATIAGGVGCKGTDDPNTGNKPGPPPPPPTTWGVFLYDMGRNETDNTALDAANQLGAAPSGLPVGVNFEAAYSGINTTNATFQTTRRIIVRNGVQGVFADLGARSLTDSAELQAYLVDAVRLSGAQRYAVFIHGHGGGPVSPMGADTIAPTGSGAINLAALDAALAGARSTLALAKFDVIALDMPESANVETMAVLAKHASFMVGFEGAVPTNGFGYKAILAALQATPALDAATLANTIVGSVAPLVATKAPQQDADFVCTAIDLSKSGPVVAAVNNLATALTADVAGTSAAAAISAIGSARASAVEFEMTLGTQIVDVSDFAAHLNAAAPGALSAASATAVAAIGTSITNAVKQVVVGDNFKNAPFAAAGLGIYFPANAKRIAASYTSSAAAFAAPGSPWPNFLTSYHTALNASALLPAVTIQVPSIVTRGQLWTVTGTVAPLGRIADVTLYVTQTSGSAEVAVFRLPLGPPDSAGGIAYTNTASVVLMSDSALAAPFFVAPRRQTPGIHGAFAFEADVQYVNGVNTNFRAGILKAQSIAGVSSGGFGVVAWTPLSFPTVSVGINDTLRSGGISYKVFPRVLVLNANGTTASSAQSVNAYTVNAQGTLSLTLDATAIGNSGSMTVWLVAESFNGDLGVAKKVVTFQ